MSTEPQNDPYLEIGSLQMLSVEVILGYGGPNAMTEVLIRRENRDT